MKRTVLVVACFAVLSAVTLALLSPAGAARAQDARPADDWPQMLTLTDSNSFLLHHDTNSSIELIYSLQIPGPETAAKEEDRTRLRAIGVIPGETGVKAN